MSIALTQSGDSLLKQDGDTLLLQADAGDAYYSNRVLLLPFNGTNGSTSFPDASLTGATATAVADAQITTANSLFGGSSLVLDGTGDYVDVTNDAAWDFGTGGTYTIEGWFRFSDTSQGGLFQFGTSPGAADGLGFGHDGGSWIVRDTSQLLVSTGAIPRPAVGEWFHVALIRDLAANNGHTIYINGALLQTFNRNYDPSGRDFYVGVYWNGSAQYHTGNVQDFRVSDYIVYDAPFTPPAGPFPTEGTVDPNWGDVEFLFQPTSTVFSESWYSGTGLTFTEGTHLRHTLGANANSPTGFAMNGGSSSNDGYYISTFSSPISVDNTVGWTLEGNAYHNNTNAGGLFAFDAATDHENYLWGFESGKFATDNVAFPGVSVLSGFDTYLNSTWDWCIEYEPGVGTHLYINGNLISTNVTAIPSDTISNIHMGRGFPGAWRGLQTGSSIHSMRLTRGNRYGGASYTPLSVPFPTQGPATPPTFTTQPTDQVVDVAQTATFQSVAESIGTSDATILLKETNADFLDESGQGNDITPIGGSPIAGSPPVITVNEGSGQQFNVANAALLNLTEFTLEAEVWPTFVSGATPPNDDGVFKFDDGTRGWMFSVYSRTFGRLYVRNPAGGLAYDSGAVSFGAMDGQWNDFAVVRSGSSWKVFRNGSLIIDGTESVASEAELSTATLEFSRSSSGRLDGDWRYIRGASAALYSTSYTPTVPRGQATIGETPTYQWYEAPSTLLGGETGQDYSLVNAQLTDNGKQFYVIATDSGGSAQSDTATLTVNEVITGPTIDTQPQNTTVDENTTAQFTVAATASSGGGALSYQWHLVGTGAIPGATSDVLSFTALEGDSGNQYFCAVTDLNGTTNTNTVTLTVTALAPTIDTQPQNTTVDENTTATFTVTATTSGGALTYQWFLVGTGALGGETSNVLSFTALEGENGFQYYCAVSDDNGTVNTNTVTLTVTALTPTIDTQPVAQSVSELSQATFTVAATASVGVLTYQWYETTAGLLSGEITDTLLVTTTLVDDGNGYYVVVGDDNGSIQSNTAGLTVTALPAPTINTQPTNALVISGTYAAFSVVATAAVGAEPLTYQWYENGILMTGETGDILEVLTDTSMTENTYYVVVTDSLGKTTTSDTVTLYVSLREGSRMALVWNFEDDNYTWMDASAESLVPELERANCLNYGFDPGWQMRWSDLSATEWSTLTTDQTRWSDFYSQGAEQNMYMLTDSGVWKMDQVVLTNGLKQYYVERTNIDLDDLNPQWTTNNFKHLKQFYFHLQSELPEGTTTLNNFDFTVGWSQNLMDDPAWLTPVSVNLQETDNSGKYKVDFRTTGRYLSLRMDFDATGELIMTGGDMDAELSHGR